MRAKNFFLSMITFVIFSASPRLHSEGKVPIRLFIQMSSEEQSSNNGIFEFIEAYNQSQDRIELMLDITTAGCSFDAADTLLARIAAGHSPDLTMLKYFELWDHFLDLKPYLNGCDLSDVDTTFFSQFNYQGRQIYYPTSYGTNLLFYDKDLFDQGNVAYPPHQYETLYEDGEPWDIQKLEEIAMQLTLDRGGHNASDPEFDAAHIEQYGFHWAWNNGIGFIQPFGPPRIFDAGGNVIIPECMREGYMWSHEGIWEKHFIPSNPVFENEMGTNPIGSGKCAMVLTGGYYVDDMDSTVNWDIAAIPSYNGTHNISWGAGGLAILKTTPYPEEAFEILMMITNLFQYYAGGLGIPTKISFQEDLIESWASDFPGVDTQVFLDGLNYLSPLSDAEAVQYKMGAWRYFNWFRDFIRNDPYMDINGGINTWLIPNLEPFFQTACIKADPIFNGPERCFLHQNYPNPFNPATSIFYSISDPGWVSLKVYDISGRIVETLVSKNQKAGLHEVMFDGSQLAGGVYVYQVQTKEFVDTRKLVLVK